MAGIRTVNLHELKGRGTEGKLARVREALEVNPGADVAGRVFRLGRLKGIGSGFTLQKFWSSPFASNSSPNTPLRLPLIPQAIFSLAGIIQRTAGRMRDALAMAGSGVADTWQSSTHMAMAGGLSDAIPSPTILMMAGVNGGTDEELDYPFGTLEDPSTPVRSVMTPPIAPKRGTARVVERLERAMTDLASRDAATQSSALRRLAAVANHYPDQVETTHLLALLDGAVGRFSYADTRIRGLCRKALVAVIRTINAMDLPTPVDENDHRLYERLAMPWTLWLQLGEAERSSENRLRAFETFSAIAGLYYGMPVDLTPLLQGVSDPEAVIRMESLQALAKGPGEWSSAVMTAVLSRMADHDPSVRYEAVVTTRKMFSRLRPTERGVMAAALRHQFLDTNPRVQQGAIRLYGDVVEKLSLEELKVGRAALDALSGLANPVARLGRAIARASGQMRGILDRP